MFAGSVGRTYTYDAVGNPMTMRGLGGADYTYDARNRLTEASYSNGDFVGFAYDGVGNRTTKDTPDGATTYSYDAADQLANSSGPDGDLTYSYDAAGRQTQAGARSFAWDAAGRLAATTQDSATTEYAYDGDGQRVSVTADGATTQWLQDINTADGLARLALERDSATGNTIRRHHYDHGPMAVNADHLHYTLRGRLGSTIAVVDAGSGIIERDQTYYPYGALRSAKTGGAADTPLRFTGAYQDPTGDYHLRARQYNPETGRFRSRDPLTPALTDPYVASYAYARNQPTVLTDPSGELAVSLTVLAIGVAAGAISGGTGAAIAGGDAGDIATAAGIGGGVGLGAAFIPAGGLIASTAVGIGSATAGDVTGQLVAGRGVHDVDTTQTAIAAGSGAVGGLSGGIASLGARKILNAGRIGQATLGGTAAGFPLFKLPSALHRTKGNQWSMGPVDIPNIEELTGRASSPKSDKSSVATIWG